LRHTTYWYETDIKTEWPLSANAAEEEAPRDDEPFDCHAKPQKFYFEVETDGSLGPQEVVMRGLTELQTKLANLVLGLKSDPTELDALGGGDGGAQIPPANGTLPAQAAPRATGWGQEASPSGWGGTAGTPGGGGGGGGGGWGTSPAGGGGTAWGGSSGPGASPSAGGWGTGSNAAAPGPGPGGAWGTGGSSSGWGTTGSPGRNTTGWSSPNPQTQSGWNV